MLSGDLRYLELLKRTYPTLNSHAHEIGEKTYINMFNDNNEIKLIFKNTPPEKSERLVDTIIMYTTEIDNFSLIYGKLDKIEHIHIKHSVKNEYYPIMKNAFIQALCEILEIDEKNDLVKACSYGITKLSQELIHIENLIRKYTQEEKDVLKGFHTTLS